MLMVVAMSIEIQLLVYLFRWTPEEIYKDLYKDAQSKTLLFFLFCPSGGDQAENFLGQDSSDDNHSGIHGPSLTSDAPFLPDYQDEGECHFSGFWLIILCCFLSWCLCPLSFDSSSLRCGFSELVITSLQRTTICFIVVLGLLVIQYFWS